MKSDLDNLLKDREQILIMKKDLENLQKENEQILGNLENKELCAKCGGFCCKQTGCMYDASDFSKIDVDTIIEALDTCRVSIRGYYNGKLKKVLLYLKARNINREAIDLMSLESPCASLEENGCFFSFNNRPMGGRYLIPKPNLNCYMSESKLIKIRNSWIKYQSVLREVVMIKTGLTPEEKFSMDMEDTFYECLDRQNTDAREADIEYFYSTPYLFHFKEERRRALERFNKEHGKKDFQTLMRSILERY